MLPLIYSRFGDLSQITTASFQPLSISPFTAIDCVQCELRLSQRRKINYRNIIYSYCKSQPINSSIFTVGYNPYQ